MLNKWAPSSLENLEDGDSLHHLLYEKGELTSPRVWCRANTDLLLDKAVLGLQDRLQERLATKKPIHIVDFGSGTGFAVIELIKKLELIDFFKKCSENNIKINLFLLDFPHSWFAKAYQLLRNYPFVKFYSLKDLQTGKILSLRDLFIEQSIDILIASMVFHLLPLKTLSDIIQDFAFILKKNGLLLWNSPDIGPVLQGSVLVHDPDRMLRKMVLNLLKNELPDSIISKISSIDEQLLNRIRHLGSHLTKEEFEEASALAKLQILEVPISHDTIANLLSLSFYGNITFTNAPMTEQDSLDLISVPSNHRHYLFEIKEEKTRLHLIQLLMRHFILPQFYDAKPQRQFNLHWTIGEFKRK
jgi:hypothetical protein